MAKRIITVHIEDDTLKKLDQWAERADRSRNWLINNLILAALEDDAILTAEFQKAGKM